MLFNRILIPILLLISVGFFGLKYFPDSLLKLIQIMAVGFMLVSILVRYVYGSVNKRDKKFTYPIILILIGVFLSSLIANAYHYQSYLITLWAQAPMYWFVFYFFLSANNYKREELEKNLMVFAIIYSILYLIQFAIYPNLLFDVRIDVDEVRGTIRIFLYGFVFLVIGYFIFLNKFFSTNKLIYVLPLILFFSVVILLASRQHFFSILLVTIYGIIFTKGVKSRSLIVFLIAISAFPIYLIFEDIIMNIIQLSTTALEGEDSSANIRGFAIKFFLNDFMPSNSAYILGNGEDHMRSLYGAKMMVYRRALSFYLSDIGIIGEYVKYGVFLVIGALIIILKLVRFNINKDLNYIRYYGIYIIIVLPVASSFTAPATIFVLCILFYLIDLETERKRL